MSKRFIIDFAASFFLLTSIITAQELPWRVYTSGNSDLPDDFILSLSVDSLGNKWIGTGYSGVVKFDGETWTNYNQANSGMPDNWIPSIKSVSHNNIWIGTMLGGLVHYDGNIWTVFEEPGSVLAMPVAHGDNPLWMGTYGGLTVFNNSEWKSYDMDNSSIPSNEVTSIAYDFSSMIWIGTSNGLASFEDNSFVIYNIDNSPLPYNYIFAVAVDQNDTKWIGTSDGLASFDNENWNVYTTMNSDLPNNAIWAISIDKDNNKWIGTGGGGLVKFDGAKWEIFNSSTAIGNFNYTRSIAIDDSGNVWAGSNGFGLTVLRTSLISDIDDREDLLPKKYALDQNYPNPFNPRTIINYELPISNYVNLSIFNLLGQKVTTLVSEKQAAGRYQVRWDASGFSSGVYYYQLMADEFTEMKKMMLLK